MNGFFQKYLFLLLFVCLFGRIGYASVFSLKAERLEKAIHTLQKQRKTDGTSVPEQDLRVLYSNLARLKSASKFKERRFLFVDIAGFSVTLYENDKPLFHSRALVGHRTTPTLTFVTSIDKIVINPWWTIPKDIAIQEMLPIIQRKPEILDQTGITVSGMVDNRMTELPPNQVNWESLSKDNFPLLFRQAPGSNNPLGAVKFQMPNPFSIVIHGTSEPQLFQSENRAVSHGCVRVENSLDLALMLLEASEPRRWTKETISKLRSGNIETAIPLKKKVPVYFGYWTTWADENLKIHYRKDIYGWDGSPDHG